MLKSGNNTSNKRNLSAKRILGEVKLNKKRKMVGIVSLFIITFSLIILITGKTYASCTDLDGYTVSSGFTERKGYTSGAFAINLAKCTTAACSASTKYATSVITVTPYTTPGQGNNTKALYDNYHDYSRAFKFSSSLSSYVMVGDSPSKGYASSTVDLRDSGDGECFYVAPPMKVKAPKGYRYYSYHAGYPNPLFPFSENSPVGFFKYNYSTEYDETAFNSSTNGPYANDTWVKGYMNFSLASAGLVTRMTDTTEQYFAIRESANIRFRPNTTTITFNANGGTGTTASKTKTYDATLSVPNSFTRSGYAFSGWNTKANGTGTQYGTSLAKNIWPATTSITLYAQWRDTNATCENSWEGFDINQSGTDTVGIGYNSGYFCMHLAKNGVKYASDKIDVSLKTTGTSGSTAMYKTNACYDESSCAQRFTFSNSDDSHIQVTGNEIAGTKIALSGAESTGFPYLSPSLSIKVPRGYKYGTYTLGWGSPITSQPYLTLTSTNNHVEGQANPGIFADSSRQGPFAEDTWINGYVGTSLIPVGLISQNYDGVRYKHNISGNVNFVPNETTVHYNANGGTLEDEEQDTMEDSTHIYDEESYISPNDYVKEDAIFDKWCTQANGGGTCYEENEDVTTEFPTESEVTLYAIWKPHYSATIYYQASSENGVTQIAALDLDCTVESGTSCTVTIPDIVRNSVGTYNNSYAGLAGSVGTMSASIAANATTITLSSNKTYYAVYSSNVTNYYYSS